MRRLLLGLLVVLVVLGGVGVFVRHARPSLEAYADRWLPRAEPERGEVRVTFLGVSTLLFSDGETQVLTDGFFSRPGLLRTLLTRIEPDRGAVQRNLERAGIDRLAAVLAVHSHYDHAMDVGEIARFTDAVVIGSKSTARIAQGAGVSPDRLSYFEDASFGPSGRFLHQLGRFRVEWYPSRHIHHGMAMGEISEPLRPPVRATDYKEGGSYSLLFTHGGQRALVQGSASWSPGALEGVSADVVFLGIGLLGKEDRAYLDQYWQEVVARVGARRVILIHWDDFFRSLDAPLVPMPRVLDPTHKAMELLFEKGRQTGVDVRLVAAFTPVDPFADLPATAAAPAR